MVDKLQKEKEAETAAIAGQFEETKRSLNETDGLLRTHKEDLTKVGVLDSSVFTSRMMFVLAIASIFIKYRNSGTERVTKAARGRT